MEGQTKPTKKLKTSGKSLSKKKKSNKDEKEDKSVEIQDLQWIYIQKLIHLCRNILTIGHYLVNGMGNYYTALPCKGQDVRDISYQAPPMTKSKPTK